MRFGIHAVDITPPFRTKMAGYGARYDCYDDVHDPLTFTAIVLEERGRRACIGAADLISFDDAQVMVLRERVARAVGAPVDNVMLNASHTHGGPMLADRPEYFPEGMADASAARRYRAFLGRRVVAAARAAVKKMQPGSLWLGVGKSAVPMNRRPERDGRVVLAPNPGGPVDDRLCALALRDDQDALRAVVVRLSCHPVSTGAQHRITADYPGAWRAAFARVFGRGVTPIFLQGAGGDARPAQVADGDRWRVMPHGELSQIGDALLAENLAVLASPTMGKLGRLALRGRLRVAEVPCEKRNTTREQLEALLSAGSSLERRYAEAALRHLEADGRVPSTVPIRVHTLWLTDDLAVVGIQGEVLCGLGAHVEKALAPARALLLGYTNGCMCYLPDSRELARGGYEQTSYLYRGWSGPFEPGTEKAVAAAVWRRKR